MNYENISISLENEVLTLVINRPKAMNALNRNVFLELDYFFTEDAPKRNDFSGIIITGAGDRAFVAGADIKELIGLSEKEGSELSAFGQNVFFKIERFTKPVIAVVNGFALGGGCELAMACHMRIAEENARFGQPEVNLGLIPGYGGTQRLIQYIGKTKAIELLLTANVIKADEALQLGLVNYSVEKGQGIQKASELIQTIRAKGPLAVSKTIETINAYFDNQKNGYEVEYRNFGKVIQSEDSQEGAKAFIEKRKADFKGK
jgi:enoyl-CoA hydratase